MRILKTVAGCFTHACIGLVFAAGVTVAAETPASAPKAKLAPTGKIVITLDDGLESQYVHGRPIMRKHGLPGTLFINTNAISDEVTEKGQPWATMSWAQVQKWADIGWEIGAHSHSHADLTKVDEKQLREELGFPAALIARKLGHLPTSFASPFGEYNDEVLEVARQIYGNHIGAWGAIEGAGEGSNSMKGVDPYRVNRLIVERDMPVGDVCASIENAGKQRILLVLGFHGIVPKPRDGVDGEFDVSVENFEEIARCTLGSVLKGSVEATTVEEALRTIPHLMAVN